MNTSNLTFAQCLKLSEESCARINQVIKKAEETNPEFRKELYAAICKKAGIADYIGPIRDALSKSLNVSPTAASAILGSGGGALAGLVGSPILGIDPVASMLGGAAIGGVGGGALQHFGMPSGIPSGQPGSQAASSAEAPQGASGGSNWLTALGLGGGAVGAGLGARALHQQFPGALTAIKGLPRHAGPIARHAASQAKGFAKNKALQLLQFIGSKLPTSRPAPQSGFYSYMNPANLPVPPR